jgi:hypothetical protein
VSSNSLPKNNEQGSYLLEIPSRTINMAISEPQSEEKALSVGTFNDYS